MPFSESNCSIANHRKHPHYRVHSHPQQREHTQFWQMVLNQAASLIPSDTLPMIYHPQYFTPPNGINHLGFRARFPRALVRSTPSSLVIVRLSSSARTRPEIRTTQMHPRTLVDLVSHLYHNRCSASATFSAAKTSRTITNLNRARVHRINTNKSILNSTLHGSSAVGSLFGSVWFTRRSTRAPISTNKHDARTPLANNDATSVPPFMQHWCGCPGGIDFMAFQ